MPASDIYMAHHLIVHQSHGTKNPFRVSIFRKGFLFFHMKLYIPLDFACQHKGCGNADTRIDSVCVVRISRMPQQKKHRGLQNGGDSCPSAEMSFLFLVKFPVLAVHGTERQYDPQCCRQYKQHSRNGRFDKQATRIYRDKQDKV